LFLISRIFKYIGIRGALFVLPCLALGSQALFIAAPILGIIRIVKVAENSTDYSLQNTGHHAIFLPTSREAKFKSKAAIDTFFWRLGDILQAAIVFVGVQLAFAIQHFAITNLAFVGIWLLVVTAIAREHKRLSARSELKKAA
jgi:AAA family ATP:ADP antiporter